MRFGNAFDLQESAKIKAALQAQLDLAIRARIGEMLDELLEKAKEASPVGDPSTWRSGHAPPAGYQPGGFAGAWAFFVGSAPPSPYGVGGDSASQVEVIARWTPGMDLGVVNNKRQSRRLAYHQWSIQVPHNWIDLFVAEAIGRFG